MSFGSSLRFQAKTEGGKPMIFWEEQGAQKKQNKKFGYKDKGVKIPLRSKGKLEEQEPVEPKVPATRKRANTDAVEKKQPTNENKGRGQSTNQNSEQKQPAKENIVQGDKGVGQPEEAKQAAAKNANQPQTSKQTSRTKRTTQKPAGRTDANTTRAGKTKANKNKENDDTVILTKKQMDIILETVGKLVQENSTLKVAADDDGESLQGTLNQLQMQQKKTTSTEATAEPEEENILNLIGQEGHTAVVVEAGPTEQPGHKEQSSSEAASGEAASQSETTTQPQAGNSTVETTRGIPRGHLTKAEKKRLQWELERTNQQQEYNPWGKPGAGAPIRDNKGNILADFNYRKEEEPPSNVPNQGQANSDSEYLIQQADKSNQPAEHNIQDQALNATQPGPSTTEPTDLSASGRIVPAAIRSSFAAGAVAPDDEQIVSDKERQRKQWLEDLEKQREEKRLQKQREKEMQQQEGVHDTWADRLSVYQPTSMPSQDKKSPVTQVVDDSVMATAKAGTAVAAINASRANSAPQTVAAANEGVDLDSSTHLRGQNVLMDPTTRKELEEKRQKHLEHQEYIKAQVEEKQRQKRLERERKFAEEQAEEARLRKERENLQKQYDMEKQKLREKEEAKTRQLEQLKEAMDRAEEDARRAKHEQRLQRLQQAGHDVSHLHASYEGGAVAVDPVLVEALDLSSLQQTAHVSPRGPSQMTNTGTILPVQQQTPRDVYPSPRDAPQVSYRPQQVVHEAYTENRVLTPTVFRPSPSQPHSDPLSPKREFGVQTEFAFKETTDGAVSRESTQIEYKGTSKGNVKKVRVKSAAKEDSKTTQKRKGPIKIEERPGWGQSNKQNKKPMKQSERDPYYEKRKKQTEARRLQRQKELQAQAEANSRRMPTKTTAATRARSRSPPLDGGQNRNRSHSPPVDHNQHQRMHSPLAPDRLPEPPQRDQGQGTHRSQGRGSRKGATPDRLDSHRSVVNGYADQSVVHRTSSPPVPTLQHKIDSSRSPPNSYRSGSPPVPALKHKPKLENDFDLDVHSYSRYQPHAGTEVNKKHNKYTDASPVNPPVHNGDFIPFIRSTNVLDPAHADSPVPVSREASVVDRARKAYLREHQPAQFGSRMENYEDTRLNDIISEENEKNPIFNPGMVKDHPTQRQDMILQQLSDLRRGLLQKQRELEFGLAPTTEAPPLDGEQEY